MVMIDQSKIDYVTNSEEPNNILRLVDICPLRRMETVWLFAPSSILPEPRELVTDWNLGRMTTFETYWRYCKECNKERRLYLNVSVLHWRGILVRKHI